MRNILPFATLAALGVLYACGSSSDDAANTPAQTDGATKPASKDAAVLADASETSGNDAGVSTDAGTATDAAIPSTLVKLWAHAGPEARVGWTMVAHNAAGDVLRQSRTGLDGRAELSATDVAMVTLLSKADAFTFTGVKAGDVLELAEPNAAQGAALGTLDMTLPTTPSGTAYMGLVSACESLTDLPNRVSWSVAVNASCVGKSGKVTVFALLQDGDYRISHQGIAAPATPPVAGGTSSTVVSSYTNSPSFFEFSGPRNLINLSSGIVVDGKSVDMVAWQKGFTRGGRWPSFAGTAEYIDFSFSQPDAAYGKTSKIYYAARILGGTPKIDLGAAPLPGPVYTEASADNTDPVRPTLKWTAQGSTSSLNGTLLRTRFANGRTWAFLVAGGARDVRVPSLPAALGFAPTMGVDGPYVIGVESTRFASADAFRQRGMYLSVSNQLREEGLEVTKGYVYFPSFR